MSDIVVELQPIVSPDERVFAVQACGIQREDGRWEGWLAFFDAAGDAWHTPRETVQPNRKALEYWATGLEPIYLDGALRRTVKASPTEAVTDSAGSTDEGLLEDVLLEELSGSIVPDGAAAMDGESVVRGRVVAVDPTTGQLKLRTGPHLMTLTTPLAQADHVRVGQLVTVRLEAA